MCTSPPGALGRRFSYGSYTKAATSGKWNMSSILKLQNISLERIRRPLFRWRGGKRSREKEGASTGPRSKAKMAMNRVHVHICAHSCLCVPHALLTRLYIYTRSRVHTPVPVSARCVCEVNRSHPCSAYVPPSALSLVRLRGQLRLCVNACLSR